MASPAKKAKTRECAASGHDSGAKLAKPWLKPSIANAMRMGGGMQDKEGLRPNGNATPETVGPERAFGAMAASGATP